MKKFFFSLSLALVALTAAAQQPNPLPIDSAVRVGQLENGLTYYIRHNELPKERCEFHIAQAVGAILEEDNQNGLAHFLEHMAFNGTEHFPGKGIIKYFESQGVSFGYNINAYTSLDETVYNLSNVPTTREGLIDSALLVMHDWSCGLLLTDEEIDNERGVIREEWRTRMTASRRTWKEMNKLMFPGSQYAKRDVIGDTAVINNFAYDDLRAYYKKWYGPDLQAIIVVGDIDVDAIEAKIKALWADVPARANRGERPIYEIDDNAAPIVAIVKDKETRTTNIEIHFKKDKLPQELQGTDASYTMDIIQDLIFRMLGTRFYELTQDPAASFLMGDGIFPELVKSKDAFCAEIYGAKSGQETKAYGDLLYQLEKMRRYGFTADELERAKIKVLTSYESSYNERNARENDDYVYEYTRHYLDGEPIPGIAWEYAYAQEILPKLSLEQVNQVAQSLVTAENVIISFTAPEDVTLPSQDTIVQMFAGIRNAEIEAPVAEVIDTVLVKQVPKMGKIKKVEHNAALGTTEWTLKNGIRVIIKPTEFKQDEICISASSMGGTSLIDDPADLVSANWASSIVDGSGLGEFNAIQLSKALTGKSVFVFPNISTYEEDFWGMSTVRDFETALQLIYLYFTAPRKDQQAFERFQSSRLTQLENDVKNPKSHFSDSIQMMGSDYSPRTILLNKENISQISLDKAYEIYCQRFANPADFTFFFTGNINPDDKKTKDAICQWLGSLKTKKNQREDYIDRGVRAPKGLKKNYFEQEMITKTASNYIRYTAPMEYTLVNDLNMEMIARILDTRYLESIREREGGSYGVSCSGYCSRYTNEASLYMRFDTDPEKQEKLLAIIHEEVMKIVADGPLAEDLAKEKAVMLKDYQESLERNGYWNGTILSQYYLYGVNYLQEYEAAVNAITAETVQATLKKLVNAGNMFEVVMLPAD